MKTAASCGLLFLAVVLGLFAASTAVWAIPVQFTYTGTIAASGIAGMNGGDSVVITVLADNGGISVISQSWNEADLLSATLTAGSYSATYAAPLSSSVDPAFRTDSLGVLDRVEFLGGVLGLNSDSFGVGGSVLLFDDSILDFYGNPAVLNNPLSDQQRLSLWSGPTPAPVSVPEPSTLVLLTMALLPPAAVAWRRVGGLAAH